MQTEYLIDLFQLLQSKNIDFYVKLCICLVCITLIVVTTGKWIRKIILWTWFLFSQFCVIFVLFKIIISSPTILIIISSWMKHFNFIIDTFSETSNLESKDL